jgi:hypothetical protein
MKITKADIKQAIANAPANLNNEDIRLMQSVFLGFYPPRDANWSYELHVISVENRPVMVASRFGHILAEGK